MSSGPCEAQVMKGTVGRANCKQVWGNGAAGVSSGGGVIVFFFVLLLQSTLKWIHQSVRSTFHCSVNTILNCTLQFSSEKSFQSPSITKLTSAEQIYWQGAKSDDSFWEGKRKKEDLRGSQPFVTFLTPS